MRDTTSLPGGPDAFRSALREYLYRGQLLEFTYRDGAGQVCTAHDVVRDIFSRAGQDFILLGRGVLLPFDCILTLNGQPVAGAVG